MLLRKALAAVIVAWMHGLEVLATFSSAARSWPARQPIEFCDVLEPQFEAAKTDAAVVKLPTMKPSRAFGRKVLVNGPLLLQLVPFGRVEQPAVPVGARWFFQ